MGAKTGVLAGQKEKDKKESSNSDPSRRYRLEGERHRWKGSKQKPEGSGNRRREAPKCTSNVYIKCLYPP
jgi:hypothetical protein